MTSAVDVPQLGDTIEGPRFSVTRETIREFCDGSLDYNPLHLDDEFMRGRFGKTEFGGVIMHGMTNFGLITRMLTDWLYPRGGIHRRLETRWLAPVRPGDSIQPLGVVAAEKTTNRGRWLSLDIQIRNQRGEQIARGEALVEFPLPAAD